MTVDPIGRFEKEHDVALAALARLEAAAEALRGGGAGWEGLPSRSRR